MSEERQAVLDGYVAKYVDAAQSVVLCEIFTDDDPEPFEKECVEYEELMHLSGFTKDEIRAAFERYGAEVTIEEEEE